MKKDKMPIFDYVRREYGNDGYGTIYAGLCPTQQFWKDLKVRKSRDGFECVVCNKKKPKGTRYIGGNYVPICFLCFSEWVKISKGTLLEIEEKFKEIEKEFEENKHDWNRELIVNSLGE